jgi:purine-cytosine permease-like protein
LGIFIYVAYTLSGNGGLVAIFAYRPAQPQPFLPEVSLTVSTIALMGAMGGDCFRHTNSNASAIAGIARIIPTAIFIFCIGAAGVIVAGQSDVRHC